MNIKCVVLGVGCVLITACGYAEGVSTNLLSKSQLQKLDKNGNNILDYKELETLPKAQSEAALDAYDINSDGDITAAELERVPRTKEDLLKEAKKEQQPVKAKKQDVKKPQEKKKAAQKKAPAKKPDAKKPAKK